MPASGCIDVIRTSGFIEGWAFDSKTSPTPLVVSVFQDDGKEIAWGLANLHNPELMSAEIGLGWCAFKLRLAVSPYLLRRRALILMDRVSIEEIGCFRDVAYEAEEDLPVEMVEHAIQADPLSADSIKCLSACDELFARFIRRRGPSEFVRTAYVYALGRPADSAGLAHYVRLIRRGAMTPFMLLEALASSDEFRSRHRSLSAPPAPEFPFLCS